MPKISQLSHASVIDGNEIVPAVQNGVTVNIAAKQIAALSGLSFTGLTGEVTSPFGSLNTTINKSITPTWLSLHTFNVGLAAEDVYVGHGKGPNGGASPNGSAAWIDVNGNFNAANVSCNNGGGYYLDLHETLIALNGYTFLFSQTGLGYIAIGNNTIPDPKNYYKNDNHTFQSANGQADYMEIKPSGVEIANHLTAERMTVGAPPSTDTGPGDIYLTGGIGVNIGVVGAEGTVNVAEAYYVNGTHVLDSANLNTAVATCNTVNTAFLVMFQDFLLSSLLPANVMVGAFARINNGQAGLAWGDIAVGGGGATYLVWSNGVNWTVMGK